MRVRSDLSIVQRRKQFLNFLIHALGLGFFDKRGSDSFVPHVNSQDSLKKWCLSFTKQHNDDHDDTLTMEEHIGSGWQPQVYN